MTHDTHLGIVWRTFILGVTRGGGGKNRGVLVGHFGLSNGPGIFTTYFHNPKDTWSHGADINQEQRIFWGGLMDIQQPELENLKQRWPRGP